MSSSENHVWMTSYNHRALPFYRELILYRLVSFRSDRSCLWIRWRTLNQNYKNYWTCLREQFIHMYHKKSIQWWRKNQKGVVSKSKQCLCPTKSLKERKFRQNCPNSLKSTTILARRMKLLKTRAVRMQPPQLSHCNLTNHNVSKMDCWKIMIKF